MKLLQLKSGLPQFEVYLYFPNLLFSENILNPMLTMLRINSILQEASQSALQMH